MTIEQPQASTPRISVLLPVYNGMPYLEASVGSLLGQTWTDFELIAINDGSSDGSGEYLDSLQDPRVRVIHQPNLGLAGTLNVAIACARGEYLARQDQDDVSHRERFARQIEFLEANPSIAVLGTAAQIIDGVLRTERTLQHPCPSAELRLNMLFDNYLVHSSVMMRRHAVEAVGGYCENRERQPPEDYELWSRIARLYPIANLREALIDYREVSGSMSRTGINPFRSRVASLCAENIAWVTGRSVEAHEVQALAKLIHADPSWRKESVRLHSLLALLEETLRYSAELFGATSEQMQVVLAQRRALVRWRYIDDLSNGIFGTLARSKTALEIRRLLRFGNS